MISFCFSSHGRLEDLSAFAYVTCLFFPTSATGHQSCPTKTTLFLLSLSLVRQVNIRCSTWPSSLITLQYTYGQLKTFKPIDNLPSLLTKPTLLDDGTCLFPPLLWYGYPASKDYDHLEIFEKCGRILAFVYGCEPAGAVIELGSSRRVASQAAIDNVKTAFGFTEEPKWYLSRDRPLWRAVKW